MPHTYKLHYFNVKGFAEISRLIFAAAGVEYEDIRYERETTWPEAKKNMPYGTVPVLEIDDGLSERPVMLTESFTIAKYLAVIFNLNGKTALEGARIDEIVEFTRDLIKDLLVMHYEKDQNKKEKIQEELKVKLPVHLAKLEKKLLKNNSGDGFFVGDKLSLADLQVYAVTSSWMPAECLVCCPKVQALNARIEEIHCIKKWLEIRPKTDH
ncbi:glutathione S-transferase-like [Lineus longissimus]|uniref:glutathione S-transferase-like n=1 Tax=Lineus longissimus TaxID=88925 RepID=UPI002B4C2657